MKSNYISYDHSKSSDRIKEILNTSDASYEEVDTIPDATKLTYTNGFYVNCTAVFIDIRKSSALPGKYQKRTLARLYRSFISECVAVVNGNSDCREIVIVGDCISGFFNTPYKVDIDNAFSVTYNLNSMIGILNYHLKKKGIDPIEVGIGISYGRALMIKAGYNGSGLNEIVWMGDVVNEASNLCHFGNKTYSDRAIMVSSSIYDNLSDHNKGLLSYNSARSCYHGNVVNTLIEDWKKENLT